MTADAQHASNERASDKASSVDDGDKPAPEYSAASNHQEPPARNLAPEFLVVEDSLSLETNVVSGGTSSDDTVNTQDDVNPVFEDLEDPTMEERIAEQFDTEKIVQEIMNERSEVFQDAIDSANSKIGAEDLSRVLGGDPKEVIPNLLGKPTDGSNAVVWEKITPITVVKPTAESTCPQGGCSERLYSPERITSSFWTAKLPNCEVTFQGLLGCLLIFFFILPSFLPGVIRRTFGPWISESNRNIWSWIRIVLVLFLVVRLSMSGVPDGFLESFCDIPKPEAPWPQLWYCPELAIPRFRPNLEDMSCRRRG